MTVIPKITYLTRIFIYASMKMKTTSENDDLIKAMNYIESFSIYFSMMRFLRSYAAEIAIEIFVI